MQAAARAAALASNAPNNLGSDPRHSGQQLPDVLDGLQSSGSGPGLQVALNASGAPVLWQGASAPTQGTGAGANQVTIAQTAPQALLEWKTFDIGRATTLTFDQSAGGASVNNWIAFNYVRDPSGRPSQILGTIRTTDGNTNAAGNPEVGGQVYVLNPNGIIFGGSSQVNVHSLVVSSLPINPNLVANGLINDTSDFQFLFSASNIDQYGNKTAPGIDAFGDSSSSSNYVAPPPANGYGDVTVQPGALLTSPAGAGNVGGAVILVAPNVTNAGTISTPDGQTILAAGLQVALTAHTGTDTTRRGVSVDNGVLAQSADGQPDPTLRGLDAYVGAVVEPGVNTTNPSQSEYYPLQYVARSDGGTGLAGQPWTGVATNENSGGLMGVIEVPEGDLTMVGAVVNQLGVVDSKTSVALNGRVDLLACYNSVVLEGQFAAAQKLQPFSQQSTGLVNLGAGSLTQILPDSSGGTAVGTELTLPSQIYVQAHSIHLASGAGSNSGALVLAPSGSVSMTAGDFKPNSNDSQTNLILDGGQVYLDTGADIDVSGSQDVSASVAENIVSMQLRGTELADSPLEQGGPLQGATVQIDIRQTGTYDGQPWVGTPLAITNGYIGLIQRTVGELTTAGGSVSIGAGGSVVMQPGSSVNVSGGWIDYQGAFVQTTELTSEGIVYPISKATPNIIYDGIFTGTTTTTDSKWGVTQTTTNALPPGMYEPGYVQGGSGGAISITAPSIAPDGTLLGYTVAGPRQINAPNAASLAAAVAAGIDPNVWDLSTVPSASRLSLLFQAQQQLPNVAEYAWYSPLPPDVQFTADTSNPPAIGKFDPNGPGDASTWSAEAQRTVLLNTDLVLAEAANPSVVASGGFGVLNIENSDGTIEIPKPAGGGAALDFQPGGSMTLTAANIDVEGSILAPGGNLNFFTYDVSPYLYIKQQLTSVSTLPPYNPKLGSFILGASSSLDTAGLTIDERGSGGAIQPLFTGGGSVVIEGTTVDLKSGGVVDVSGGAVIGANGSVSYGRGGAIQILAGRDPFSGTPVINNDGTTNTAAVQILATDATLGGTLSLDATLLGYSGTRGGTLGIEAPAIQIGGTDPDAAIATGTLWLPATSSGEVAFFNDGGFATFNLAGIGLIAPGKSASQFSPGFLIEPGVDIDPVIQSWLLDPNSGATLSPQTLPFGLRQAATLNFSATGARNVFNSNPLSNVVARGDLEMDATAEVQVDPVGFANNSTPAVAAEGSISLKGDTVDIAGSVEAPGGTIKVTGDQSYPAVGSASGAIPTVVLESTSRLSTSGALVLVPDSFGHEPGESGYLANGSVLSGGAITVLGNIVAQKGAELYANGSSGTLVLPAGYSTTVSPASLDLKDQYLPAQVDTDGGAITLGGGQELFTAATLNALAGNAGDPKSSGGTLSVYGNYYNPSASQQSALDVALVVTAAPPPFSYSGSPALASGVLENGAAAALVLNGGHVTQALSFIDAASFNNGGFASLVLEGPGTPLPGAVSFSGPVVLRAPGSITLNTPGVLYANGSVSLQASYVDIGSAFATPALSTPQQVADPLEFSLTPPNYGGGSLTVTASQLIDVGNLSLQGIGTANFNAGNGAIRGDGTLDIAGDISLSAGQIYPPTAVEFNIAAYPYKPSASASEIGGSITIGSSAGPSPQLPLSAGGVLSVFADTIVQGGTLEAPIGTINLGATAAVTDPLTGNSFPLTTALTLKSGSVTSTSAVANALVDPSTGDPEPIPYGVNVNGTEWIDPIGTNIAATGNGQLGTGLPSQQVNLSAATVSVQPAVGNVAAAKINLSGGGDLLAYQWISGTGGTVDILGSSSNYAIIPGYAATYAPFGKYGSNDLTALQQGDFGYTNGALVGTQVYLNASTGVPAGIYTLLPARYALLPGAYLVTPESGTPTNAVVEPDGSAVVSGYLLNAFGGGAIGSPLYSNFGVASSSVVQKRADYAVYSANAFFPQQAGAQNLATPRLPADAGLLAVSATKGIDLQGAVSGQAFGGGFGSLVEISGPPQVPIDINSTGTGSNPGTFYLNATQLSSFGAEGLLVGGMFAFNSGGSSVTVTADTLTVDGGANLSAADVILVANKNLTVASGAVIEQQGTSGGSIGNIVIGQTDANGNTVVSGDGLLVRVSNYPLAQFDRVGVTPYSAANASASGQPVLTIQSGAQILGGSGSVTLDSTGLASSSPNAIVRAASVNIGSGQVGIQLDPTLTLPAGLLILSPSALQSLERQGSSLSILSYSSIDIYGSGAVGGLDAAGNPELASLALHTGEIRGFGTGAGASFNAQTIILDNSPSASGPGPDQTISQSGTLTFNGDTIELGAVLPADAAHATLNNQIGIDQFAKVALVASNGIEALGSGGTNPGLAVQGSLTMESPVIYSAVGANQAVAAGGALTVTAAPQTSVAEAAGGIGATLTLQGTSVAVGAGSGILLPSGTVEIHATGGDVSVGGKIDVSGTAQTLGGLTTYTDGGEINVVADQGNVDLLPSGIANVSAQTDGGNAGTFSVSAPAAGFKVSGKVLGTAGVGFGQGSALIDVGGLQDANGQPTSSLSFLENALVTGGFVQSQTIRVRNGNVVVDGRAASQLFDLSADQGSIDVTGTIDASGETGGTIDLAARGSVTLESGSLLSVRGQNFDSAGQGGSVSLSAGTSQFNSGGAYVQNTAASVAILTGSTIDLSIVNDHPIQLDLSGASSITLQGGQTVFFPSGTPGNDQIVFGTGGTLTTAEGATTSFSAGFTTAIESGSTVVLAGGNAGTIRFASGGTGGSVPLSLPAGATISNETDVTDLTDFDFAGTLHLRAPQVLNGTMPVDVQVAPIDGTIISPSSIVVEGYQVFVPANGLIDSVENAVQDNGAEFAGGLDSSGKFHAGNTAAIVSRLTATWGGAAGQVNAGLSTQPDLLVRVQPGAEIANPTGNLELENSWNLAGLRFGPNATQINPTTGAHVAVLGAGEPGVLTLRAEGDLVFAFNPAAATTYDGIRFSGAYASLSDGFGGNSGASPSSLWTDLLLPAGSASWSFNLVSGADFTGADFQDVQALSVLQAKNTGSVVLGSTDEPNNFEQSSGEIDRDLVIPEYYQVIRTGTGDISIFSGLDVQSLNPLATIYTAGQQAPQLAGFAVPDLAFNPDFDEIGTNQLPVYPAQYSFNGGNVTISAQRDIVQDSVLNGQVVSDSSQEMPTNWLYRQGYVNANGDFAVVPSGVSGGSNNRPGTPNIASTSWWIDFSNYFEGVGALGGGNVSLTAGRDVTNVDAQVPTNARMPGFDPSTGAALAPSSAPLLELGGGNLNVQAGRDISGGVYYVERGEGVLDAGGQITTNPARTVLTLEQVAALPAGVVPDPTTWLPTTLFLGNGDFTVSAGGNVALGPVVNPFLLPQGINNSFWEKTYFSTYSTWSGVTVSSLTGSVTLDDDAQAGGASLYTWYQSILFYDPAPSANYTNSVSEPWLRLAEGDVTAFNGDPQYLYLTGVFGLMPPSLRATAFAGDVNIVGDLTLSPSAKGTADILAEGSVNGLQINGLISPELPFSAEDNEYQWATAVINLSDAAPSAIPGVASPLSLGAPPSGANPVSWFATPNYSVLDGINILINESSADENANATLQEKEALHDPGLLHAGDPNPIHIDAESGSISGLTLFSAKAADVGAGTDITNIALYIQNNSASDISVVAAGRDLIAFDATAPLVQDSQDVATSDTPIDEILLSGDIQISGPGTLEVLTGRNLNLGVGSAPNSGPGVGIVSVGNSDNLYLPFGGADIVTVAGFGSGRALSDSQLGYSSFIAQFVDPTTAGANAARYLPEVAAMLDLSVGADASPQSIWAELTASNAGLTAAGQAGHDDLLALDTFFVALRDAGRDQNNPASPNFGSFGAGYAAIGDLFPGSAVQTDASSSAQPAWSGSISLATREIATTNGGNVSILAPGGGVTVGNPSDPQKADQGILTEYGGNISIFAEDNVEVGTSRIFTLRGGNEVIWSSVGNIAAGSGSKTVFSAPPTRVLIDPQSASVKNDLAGLATGSGIGVLATLAGVPPGNVDLIAPVGTVDAGDAGIRSSGNLTIAALHVLNASNIQVSGASAGVPVVAAPNIAGFAAASNSAAASAAASTQVENRQQSAAESSPSVVPSIITVEVIGYGGGDDVSAVTQNGGGGSS
jgi:filamentous hemagglutinin family protein